jgi:hypothetical protein
MFDDFAPAEQKPTQETVLRSTNRPMFVAVRHWLSAAVGGVCR